MYKKVYTHEFRSLLIYWNSWIWSMAVVLQ